MKPHTCSPENAEKMLDWIATRGGVAIWPSIDLSDLDKSWSTPANAIDGTPTTKPHWKSDHKPCRTITDPAEILVTKDKEVKRFHVAIRMGSQGLVMKVTDGGTRRIRAAVAKAGEGAYYTFDYETQEAVIMAPEEQIPLSEWRK